MKKIETDADVLEWAQTMVEAKGDRFTPLSKGEQFVIARYIVAHADGKESTDAKEKSEQTTASATKFEDAPLSLPIPSVGGDSVSAPSEPQTERGSVTRAFACYRAGLDVQQAYDKFLEWCKSHPKSKEVMDFSTGHKSVDAAFAYWLGEMITVEVPSHSYTM